MNKILIFLSILTLAFDLNASELVLEECRTVEVSTMVTQVDNAILLDIGLINNSNINIEFYSFVLYESIIDLRAEVVSSGIEIERSIPLITPVAEKIIIEPGDKYRKKLNLSSSFPKLKQKLLESDIKLSLGLSLSHPNNCFEKLVNNTITIYKVKNKTDKGVGDT